jgi:hypothetical protein
MNVQCYGSEIEVPDFLIEKYVKDFDGLPGKSMRESILYLRESVTEVLDYVAEDPEALQDTIVLSDFINALAMKQALSKHGLYLDS